MWQIITSREKDKNEVVKRFCQRYLHLNTRIADIIDIPAPVQRPLVAVILSIFKLPIFFRRVDFQYFELSTKKAVKTAEDRPAWYKTN